MGKITLLVFVQEETVEQIDGHLRVAQDSWVACDAVGLDGAGQGVNLFVGRDGVEVVAELGGEHLLLAVAMDVDAVVPVDNVFVGVEEAHVLAQVFGAFLGAFEVAVVAGQQVGAGEAVDEA